MLETKKLPGLSIAVAKGNKIIWSKGFGFATRSPEIKIDTSSIFRIGSISKILTATALLVFNQKTMIDLHAPVKKYLPFLKESIGNVTCYQLAGHTSGVRHYHYNEFINQVQYENVLHSLEIFIHDSLLSIPGTQYAYSSFGYNVLGAVIQSVSGKEFRSSIRETVLLPLGMNSTIADSENTDSIFVSLYSMNQKGEIEPAAKTNLSDRWPSGGYWSTANDLVRLGMSLYNEKTLDNRSSDLVFSGQILKHGEKTNVGVGWRNSIDDDGIKYLHHGGQSMGGRAFLLVFPDKQLVVALLSNLTYANFGEKEALEIGRFFLK